MAINLNLRAPSANPLSFSQVDSNFTQLKQQVEALWAELANYSLGTHNHNDLYYLKSEIENKISAITWKDVYSTDQHWRCSLGGSFFSWGGGVIPPSNTYTSGIRVTFPQAFKIFPPVVMAVLNGATRGDGWTGTCLIQNVDVNGFTIVTENVGPMPVTASVPFTYFAFAGF